MYLFNGNHPMGVSDKIYATVTNNLPSSGALAHDLWTLRDLSQLGLTVSVCVDDGLRTFYSFSRRKPQRLRLERTTGQALDYSNLTLS